MLTDPEMKALAQSEIDNGKEQLERIEKELVSAQYQKILMTRKIFFLK